MEANTPKTLKTPHCGLPMEIRKSGIDWRLCPQKSCYQEYTSTVIHFSLKKTFTSQSCTFLTKAHPFSSAFNLFFVFNSRQRCHPRLVSITGPSCLSRPVGALICLACGASANCCNLCSPIRIMGAKRGGRRGGKKEEVLLNNTC